MGCRLRRRRWSGLTGLPYNRAVATLRLFAQARELAGVGKVEIDADTVGAVIEQAQAQFGSAFAAIVDNSRVWLNGAPASAGDSVDPTDEVAILPPVSGG